MRARFLLHCVAILFSAAYVGAAAAQEKALVEAYNAAGRALFRQFAANPGNIVFSPYSIGTAMAMALSGARSTTEMEMLSVLKHRLSRPEIDAANGKLMAVLNGYDQSALKPTCPVQLKFDGQRCVAAPNGDKCPFGSKREGFDCVATPTPLPWAKLLTANALMMPRRTNEISFAYVDTMRDLYQAEVFRGAGLDEINAWVAKRTEGKIEKILDEIDPNSAAVLLNAIYFKAGWASTFIKDATAEAIFHISRARQVRVPTMRNTGRFAFVTRTGYRAIRLPYVTRSIGMVVVLPNDLEGLAPTSARLNEREISDLFWALRQAAPARVSLALPRFKMMYRADLKQAFQQIGLSSPFSRDQVDFSGMTGQPVSKSRLMIAQIKHAAAIDVNETGTEAGTATAIETSPLSGSKVETFLVDRPFLFYVVDDATGAILFQGHIIDPR